MKQRLIQSSIVVFPILVLASRFWIGRTWAGSLFAAFFQELFYFATMYLGIVWWERKLKKQREDSPNS